jgi:GNAT superfamily N-acetyltransferase
MLRVLQRGRKASRKLSAGERQNIGEPRFTGFGAIRLVMIGTDVKHQGHGYGDELLDAIVGLARQVGETISVRFLIADANRLLQGWWHEGLRGRGRLG